MCFPSVIMAGYTHIFRGQKSKAVEKLPDLSLPSSKAESNIKTGTDNIDVTEGKNFAITLAKLSGNLRTPLDSTGQTNSDNDKDKAVLNAPGGIRTCDLRFRKPMLYPTELRALQRLIA